MKQPKKLTRNQKERIGKAGKEPTVYMLLSETEDRMVLWNKTTKLPEVIDKQEVCGNCRKRS